ncbi:transposable element Tc1 transposase [Trichonephila clavipes]|nr:transposable element Tc1 transposase [Trichonephila clavipes]
MDLWLATLTAVPLGLGSNPGEDIDVCKCIVPSRHGGTLNSRQAAHPLVRLVEGEERWEAPDHFQGVILLNWGETELNRSVACMVLKATTGVTQPFAIMNSVGLDLAFADQEDFGKRNMPGKRARRHFSQLTEFERGLIIGMKTAGWSTRRVAGQVDRLECAVRNCWEQWTREDTHARKTGSGATRKTTRTEDRRIVRQALVDPTVTRSTIRAGIGVAIVPQTNSRHLAEANLKSKCPFRALPLTPEHRQLRLQWCQVGCHRLAKGCV